MKLFLVFLLLSTSAFALDNKSIGGGIILPFGNYDTGVDGDIDVEMPLSFNVGMLGNYRSAKGKKFRTGIMLVQKKAEAEIGNSDFKLSLLYAMIPLTIVRSFDKGMDVFYGINPALKINDECDYEARTNDNCDGDTATIIHPLTIGLRKNLDNKLNFEVSYEHALKDNHTGVRINSLMLNLFYDL